jgi:multiple sugar transport system ATP-binding protein
VAGFIGEPPMNFLATQPVASEGRPALQAPDGSFTLQLPDNLAARVRAANAKKVHIGIRPMHMELLHAPPSNGQVAVTGDIITYEDLGEEGQLAVRVGGAQVLAVTPPALDLQRGAKATLSMRPDRIHLFDAETQNAL